MPLSYSANQPISVSRASTGKWLLLFFSIALAAVTILALQFLDRFYVETEQLLDDIQFAQDSGPWIEKGNSNASVSEGRLTLSNTAGANQSVYQNVAVDTPAFYQFDFEAGTNDVVPISEEEWARATVAVIFRNAEGERTGSQTISRLVGTESMMSFSSQVLIREDVSSIDYAFQLFRSHGEFTVTNPVVSRLAELPLYTGVKIAIIVAWIALIALLGFVVMKYAGVWYFAALALCGGVALVGVMMPEALMTELTQRMSARLPEAFLNGSREVLGKIYAGNAFVNEGSEISKIGHFLIFALLGILLGLWWQKIGIEFAIICIGAFAFCTEALQMLVNGRTTSTGDLITDTVGGIFGLIIGAFLLWCFQSVKKLVKKSPDPDDDSDPDDYSDPMRDLDAGYENR